MKYGYTIWSEYNLYVTGSDNNGEFFNTRAEAQSRAEQYVKDADENFNSTNTYEIYEDEEAN